MTKSQKQAALRQVTKRVGTTVPRVYAVLPDGTVQMIQRNK